MAKRYDATLKTMLEVSASDWAHLVGIPADRAEAIDADVSSVSAAADKVVRLSGRSRGILHFDFQAGPDASLPRRILRYNVLLGERHRLPVESVLVLLRPQANLRSLTGIYEQHFPGRPRKNLEFMYTLVRVWELPVEEVLSGGLGVLPLAPIANVAPSDLPGIIERLKEKLAAPRYRKVAGSLWTAVDVLMGLRYERAVIEPLLRGVRGMKESVTYRAIVEEGVEKGRIKEARRFILRLGEKRFGRPADAQSRALLDRMHSVKTLEHLGDRVLEVQSWEDLLKEIPPTAPRTNRKKTT